MSSIKVNPPVVILGGGGHAKVLIEVLREEKKYEPWGILDSDKTKWGKSVLGIPVKGGDDLLADISSQGINHFILGLGSTAENGPRAALFQKALKSGLTPIIAKSSSSVVSQHAVLGDGTVVFPRGIVNTSAQCGKNVIVNTRAVIEHDCQIGDHVHIASGAILASTVKVGSYAHVGAGAVVRQCINIGEGAVIGAGAVVIQDVNPWTVVVGNPAKFKKSIEPYKEKITDEVTI